MSQSPAEAVAPDAAPEYLQAIASWSELIRSGKSHSGRERNSCFLNTGTPRFADLSAASGLDFIDDARAVAQVDWDGDGDLDLWLANRTGPQLRFLRNGTRTGNHHLALELSGRRANRDAVGARVVLEPLSAAQRPLARTLHGGDGFITQSDKTLHFGLGPQAAPREVTVRWPGGEAERFTGLRADRRYRLVQGSGRAEPLRARARRLRAPASEAEPEASTLPSRIWLPARVPAPSLRYDTLEGRSRTAARDGSPLLVNLWASWCAPCIDEFRELAARRVELERSGLSILALAVDGLGDERSADTAALQELLRALDFPFTAGTARAATVDQLEILYTQLFGRALTFPVPVSFLVDGQGNLAAIYMGRLRLDEVLDDMAHLGADPDENRRRASPEPGRWRSPPRPAPMDALASAYVRAGYAEEAVPPLMTALVRDPADVEVAFALGSALERTGDAERAEAAFRHGLEQSPDDALLHHGLAHLLTAQQRYDEAIRHYEAALQRRPDDGAMTFNLAIALEGSGRDGEAAQRYRAALDLRPDWAKALIGLARLLATTADRAVRNADEAIRLADSASRVVNDAYALDTLALAYACAGRFEEAIQAAETAARLAREAGNEAAARDIDDRLQRYRRGESPAHR